MGDYGGFSHMGWRLGAICEVLVSVVKVVMVVLRMPRSPFGFHSIQAFDQGCANHRGESWSR